MLPWVLRDAATMPGGGGDLRLMQRGSEFSIMAGATELMNSRLSGSEETLATLVCARLASFATPHLLIGGLGMGFTLRAALAVLPAGAQVTVAELVPAVVDWARGPMAGLFDACLEDKRVMVRIGDVASVIAEGKGYYDAIVLDVDNGPEGLTRAANDGLYLTSGLAAARAALKPGGQLAVWSSAPDQSFTQGLRRARFTVEEQRVRAGRTGRGARHTIWIASRPAKG